MSKVRFVISMSLDGFIAGPKQSIENPLGIGGERLHEWAYQLAAWREPHGLEGGDVTDSSRIVKETQTNVGATIMGRNMFGGGPGPWDEKKPWNGWWGNDPPFHHPVFVLTHYPREPLELKGGTTFTFVTDGIESALSQAKRAANGQDVTVSGGAKAAQQYLAAGLIDEALVSVVPVLLGAGERLFENMGEDPPEFELAESVSAPGVTHLKFRVRSGVASRS